MVPSFHTADRQTFRRVVIVGLMLCAAFMAVSFFLRPQPVESRAIVKADRLIRTAVAAKSANWSLSSEVGTGSRQDNASEKGIRASVPIQSERKRL